MRYPGSALQWIGLNAYPYGGSIPAITAGYSGTPGTVIVYLDQNKEISVELAGPDTIRVHNADPDSESGSVTLMW